MKKLLILTFIVPLLTGCFSTSPVAKLDSLDQEIQWDYGQQLISKTKNDITMALSFNKSTEKYLIFDVEVTNKSEDEALIAPESFYYRCKNKYGTSLGRKGYAVNPEDKILELDRQISKLSAREANQVVLSALTTSIDAINIIASLDEDQVTKNRVLNNVSANQFHRDNMRAETRDRSVSVYEKREHWAYNALRKTTLKPGYYIGGKVYFPRNDGAGTFSFILPVNNETYVFSYDQNLK